MAITFPENVTTDSLFLWLMHVISENFENHAILKGGMALRLLDCPRNTNDLDYVFVPFKSKKEIVKQLDDLLQKMPGAKITKSMSSKALHYIIQVGDVSVQIEANVATDCKVTPMSTNSLARPLNQLGRIVRIMSLDVALSHKLAAWNERRLLRDIYDAHYIFQVVGENPDMETLSKRLNKIESRIPKMKRIKSMSLEKFTSELKEKINKLSDEAVREELAPLLTEEELTGLSVKLKVGINRLIDYVQQQ